MAIDSAEKRYSIISFGDSNQILFEVDGAVDPDDQRHLLGCYSGIKLDNPLELVNTAEKRYSVMAWRSGFLQPLFEVDGSVDPDDRRHLLASYAGIAWDNPIPPVPVTVRQLGLLGVG